MPRSLSAPTASATAAFVTRPGFLLEVDFTYTVRYSSRSDVTWNGVSWIAADLRVSQIQETPNGATSISVLVGNSDRSFGSLCLGQQPQGVAARVWAFYEGATALADPVKIFDGVIDACGPISEQSVTLVLSQKNSGRLFLPRRRITSASGFNRLAPAGRVIVFNNIRYTLVRAN